MSKLHVIFKSFLVVCFTLTFASIVQAQASRTWVSGVGDDINPCSRTAPCKTFAGAISKTATNGEINCLDPGSFGALTITKSITVDCHEIFAGVTFPGTTGVSIAFNSFAVGDTRKSVRIRNINYHGFDTGLRGIRITGGSVITGGTVVIEDCLMDGTLGSVNPNGRGIVDERTAGGELFVSNTTVRNQGGTGIAIAPSSGATTIKVGLNNVRVYNCAFGIVASSGSRVTVRDSVVSGNTSAGFFAEGPAGGSELHINNSESSHNGTGVEAAAGGTIRIGNSDIVNNTTAVTGTVLSYGNNRVAGGAGALTAIGADTHDKGQQ